VNDAGMAPPAVIAGEFTAVDDGARWKFSGALTMDAAAQALDAAHRLPLPSTGVIDFSGLLQADSAALAVMLALKRRASAQGRPIMFAGLPGSLLSLAVVYGVEELLAA
jgi:phospholipid transport system transporter-binding protein